MDELFGSKPWVEPLSTASSDQKSTDQNEPTKVGPLK